MAWEDVEERKHTKQAGVERRAALEGCMCLMSVFPIQLEIIIWSKKPWESHLHTVMPVGSVCALQTLSRATNVSEHWGLLRPPVVVPWSTVFMVEE